MAAAQFDVCGIGNAIMDLIAPESDAFSTDHDIIRGSMTLIEEDRANALTKALSRPHQSSGGSGANSTAGIGSLGGKAAYIGKVANDALGKDYRAEITSIGVDFRTAPYIDGPATARCIIVVTPDAQRSMSTFLGCSSLLNKSDLDKDLIDASAITFLEGYLFDRDDAKEAFVQAAEYAKAAGRKVALSLSDTFCVDRHRASFRQLVEHHVDILFANEEEIKALYETQSFENALDAVKGHAPIACVTRSEKGSVILAGDTILNFAASPVSKLVDTTGAGDQYAAGALFGIAKGKPLEVVGRLGSLAAAEVIGHYGARPQANLATLAKGAGLI